MSNQDLTNPADEIRKEEKYSIPSLPLPYDLALGLLKKEKTIDLFQLTSALLRKKSEISNQIK